MKLDWNFPGGAVRGCKTKKPSMRGVWIFSGTTQLVHDCQDIHQPLELMVVIQMIQDIQVSSATDQSSSKVSGVKNYERST